MVKVTEEKQREAKEPTPAPPLRAAPALPMDAKLHEALVAAEKPKPILRIPPNGDVTPLNSPDGPFPPLLQDPKRLPEITNPEYQELLAEFKTIREELLSPANPYQLNADEKIDVEIVINDLEYILYDIAAIRVRTGFLKTDSLTPFGGKGRYATIHLGELSKNPAKSERELVGSLVALFIESFKLIKKRQADPKNKYNQIKLFCGLLHGICIDARTRMAYDFAHGVNPSLFRLIGYAFTYLKTREQLSYFGKFKSILEQVWGAPFVPDQEMVKIPVLNPEDLKKELKQQKENKEAKKTLVTIPENSSKAPVEKTGDQTPKPLEIDYQFIDEKTLPVIKEKFITELSLTPDTSFLLIYPKLTKRRHLKIFMTFLLLHPELLDNKFPAELDLKNAKINPAYKDADVALQSSFNDMLIYVLQRTTWSDDEFPIILDLCNRAHIETCFSLIKQLRLSKENFKAYLIFLTKKIAAYAKVEPELAKQFLLTDIRGHNIFNYVLAEKLHPEIARLLHVGVDLTACDSKGSSAINYLASPSIDLDTFKFVFSECKMEHIPAIKKEKSGEEKTTQAVVTYVEQPIRLVNVNCTQNEIPLLTNMLCGPASLEKIQFLLSLGELDCEPIENAEACILFSTLALRKYFKSDEVKFKLARAKIQKGKLKEAVHILATLSALTQNQFQTCLETCKSDVEEDQTKSQLQFIHLLIKIMANLLYKKGDFPTVTMLYNCSPDFPEKSNWAREIEFQEQGFERVNMMLADGKELENILFKGLVEVLAHKISIENFGWLMEKCPQQINTTLPDKTSLLKAVCDAPACSLHEMALVDLLLSDQRIDLAAAEKTIAECNHPQFKIIFEMADIQNRLAQLKIQQCQVNEAVAILVKLYLAKNDFWLAFYRCHQLPLDQQIDKQIKDDFVSKLFTALVATACTQGDYNFLKIPSLKITSMEEQNKLYKLKNANDDTLLHLVMLCPLTDEIKKFVLDFLHRYPEMLTAQNKEGLTPIQVAAKKNRWDHVSHLVSYFEEVEGNAHFGQVLLIAMNLNPNVALALIAKKADLTVVNEQHEDALDLAVLNNNIGAAQAIAKILRAKEGGLNHRILQANTTKPVLMAAMHPSVDLLLFTWLVEQQTHHLELNCSWEKEPAICYAFNNLPIEKLTILLKQDIQLFDARQHILNPKDPKVKKLLDELQILKRMLEQCFKRFMIDDLVRWLNILYETDQTNFSRAVDTMQSLPLNDLQAVALNLIMQKVLHKNAAVACKRLDTAFFQKLKKYAPADEVNIYNQDHETPVSLALQSEGLTKEFLSALFDFKPKLTCGNKEGDKPFVTLAKLKLWDNLILLANQVKDIDGSLDTNRALLILLQEKPLTEKMRTCAMALIQSMQQAEETVEVNHHPEDAINLLLLHNDNQLVALTYHKIKQSQKVTPALFFAASCPEVSAEIFAELLEDPKIDKTELWQGIDILTRALQVGHLVKIGLLLGDPELTKLIPQAEQAILACHNPIILAMFKGYHVYHHLINAKSPEVLKSWLLKLYETDHPHVIDILNSIETTHPEYLNIHFELALLAAKKNDVPFIQNLAERHFLTTELLTKLTAQQKTLLQVAADNQAWNFILAIIPMFYDYISHLNYNYALLKAMEADQIDVVQKLQQRGATISVLNAYFDDALNIAIHKNLLPLAEDFFSSMCYRQSPATKPVVFSALQYKQVTPETVLGLLKFKLIEPNPCWQNKSAFQLALELTKYFYAEELIAKFHDKLLPQDIAFMKDSTVTEIKVLYSRYQLTQQAPLRRAGVMGLFSTQQLMPPKAPVTHSPDQKASPPTQNP